MSSVNIDAYMEPAHGEIFKVAARLYQVYILVRSTNKESRKYIGVPGYVAKRLDCKAKTAKANVPRKNGGSYELAGLVADPTIHPDAYAGHDVSKSWNDFRPHLYIPVADDKRVYLPPGVLYTLQTDRAHKHYGCVAFTGYGLITNKSYVFGDYDLYAIISEKNPKDNIFTVETRLGQDHSRSPFLFDVQHFLNRKIGTPMILHGEQETHQDHTNENIIIFFPDGITVKEARKGTHGPDDIAAFYKQLFGGRQTGPSGVTVPGTQWKTA